MRPFSNVKTAFTFLQCYLRGRYRRLAGMDFYKLKKSGKALLLQLYDSRR
jgi:hypothetical protein